MTRRLSNTLASERARVGWSQSRLAEAAGVSRQSYAAIEAGRANPSTEVALRLASALGRRVEELFRLPDDGGASRRAAWSGVAPASQGQRVRLARIAGRWTAHPHADAHRPDEPADAVVEGISGDAVTVRPLPDPLPPAELVVSGCDPAFGILVDTLRRTRDVHAIWGQRGSRSALGALARGEAHVAGVHVLDAESGVWNAPLVRELVPFPTTRILFSVWQQGLIVRPGGRIRGIGDLAREGVRILNREPGSGSRQLLDGVLADAGVPPERVSGYATSARGHLAIADGVASGAADAGVAVQAAGLARGLGFVPLREEAYELVVPNHFLDLPSVDALLGLLRNHGVRSQVEALGGYDASSMGRVAG